MKNKIRSSIEGSLIDLNSQEVPNFSRPSSIWLEKYVNDSLQLYPVASNHPAFLDENGAILLEPEGLNLITHNLDLSVSDWTKGSNCIVYRDEVDSPDVSTYQADRIVWVSGEGVTQVLRRELLLQPGKTYTLSVILRLPSRIQAGTNDVLRLTGSVDGTPLIKFSQLNKYPGRYRILQTTFKTSGNQPLYPQEEKESHIVEHLVSSVTSNSLTIVSTGNIVANQFVGGRINISNLIYLITGNSAKRSDNTVVISVDSSRLITDGVVAGKKAAFLPPPNALVNLEFYVESILQLDFGGIQIEERDFRTSFIFQSETMKIRSATTLNYRSNPIGGLKTFGIFLNIKDCRGEGNIFNLGNLSVSLTNENRLRFKIANTELYPEIRLNPSFKLFIQASEESTNVSLYIDKVLLAKTNLYDFVGDVKSVRDLTSQGVRCIQQFIVFDRLLLDGRPQVGEEATQEVLDLFETEVLSDSATISTNIPQILLPPIIIPPKMAPIASTRIQNLSIDSTTFVASITVADSTNFTVNRRVSVVRNQSVILETNIIQKNGNDLQLETGQGIFIGDFLVYGNTNTPGVALVRFPYTPVDQQDILEVSSAQERIRVRSSLSFTKRRAFIVSKNYEDVAEVIVKDKDDQNGWLYLNNTINIQVGHIIVQAKDELIIDPDCYAAFILHPQSGVGISHRYLNGVELNNFNNVPIEAQVVIKPFAY